MRHKPSKSAMKEVDALMRRGLSQAVFPGAVLLAAQKGRILVHRAYGLADLFSRRPMTVGTCFDLASLTKPLATTMAVMGLVQQGRIDLDRALAYYLPQLDKTDKALITVRHLLSHCSGLPAWRPYFAVLRRLAEDQRQAALRQLLVREALESIPGATDCYSDLGFMLLQWVVESLVAKPLDRHVVRTVYDPLGISALFFPDHEQGREPRPFAATEMCPWRNRLLRGEVHDDNAYVVGGFSGQAGLFGTARGIYDLLQGLLAADGKHAAHALLDREVIQLFFRRQVNGTWALGFDTPRAEGSSAGNHFSPNSVGHMGYTGTSFWMDRDRSIIIILLTNRVHPTRYNTAIQTFRPMLHDALMTSLC